VPFRFVPSHPVVTEFGTNFGTNRSLDVRTDGQSLRSAINRLCCSGPLISKCLIASLIAVS
jgi:hypothetical protein